jgi:hypothetical protein
MSHGHVERAAELRTEAEAILDGGLRALLSSYGRLVAHGSYALDLMVWRDLDLYLIAPEPDVVRFFELGAGLATLLNPRKMNFRDERGGSEKELPVGLYWGLYFGDHPDRNWKIDLWAVSDAEAGRLLAYESSVAARLTIESRQAILAVKSAVCSDRDYRRSFGAKDVYDAVLDGGVRDLAGFEHYLNATRRRGTQGG